MRYSADYGTDSPFYLTSAILLYASQQKIRLATVHATEPNPNGGPPLLSEGQPVSRQFLDQLCRNLQSELPATWLPEHVLIWSQRLVAWWEPARVRPMFFSPGVGRQITGRETLPAPSAALCRPRSASVRLGIGRRLPVPGQNAALASTVLEYK